MYQKFYFVKRSFKILMAVTIFLLLSACASQPIQTKTLFIPKQNLTITPIWVVSTGTGLNSLKLYPAYKKAVIYIANYNGEVSAITAKTGKFIWQRKLNANITAGVSVGKNYVAIASEEGELYLLDSKTGKLIRTITLSDEALARPSITNSIIYVKTIDGNLTAYSLQTGKQLWMYQHGTPSMVLRGGSSAVVFGNKVIAGFSDGELVVLNAKTGNEIWDKTIASSDAFTAVQQLVDIDDTPVIKDGVIYVASYQGQIMGLNLSDGSLVWQAKMSSYSGLAVDANQVYITDVNGTLWAFDNSSGDVDWRQPALQNYQLTGPSLISNKIIVADTQGNIYIFNKSNGLLIAKMRASNAAFNTAPLVVGNKFFALSNNGQLNAYELKHVSRKTP